MHEHIVSLAILKVNWDRNERYINNFLPFVLECINREKKNEIELISLQSDLSSTFGLEFPLNVLKSILKVAEQKKFIIRKGDIYFKNKDIPILSFSKEIETMLRTHEAVINKLIEFCKTKHDVTWTNSVADEALLAFVKKYSIDMLDLKMEVGLQIPESKTREEFLICSFINTAHQSDPQSFEYLEMLVKGSMLTSVLYFKDPGRFEQRFKNFEIYLDTKIVLRVLGIIDSVVQEANIEFIELAYELGADVYCFTHTISEIKGILVAAEQAIQTGTETRIGENIDYLVRSGYTASDVRLLIESLEQKLKEYRIKVKASPGFSYHQTIDETELKNFLVKRVNYSRPESVRHDISSLVAIYRLRKGHNNEYIELSRAIFVTTNEALASAASDFFRKNGMKTPICVVDDAFMTFVWLKKPLKMPLLPQKKLIADCYSAINPNDQLWKKYVEEIQKLKNRKTITPDQFNLLRFGSEARATLMELTYGKPAVFVDTMVPQVLSAAEESLKAETAAKLQMEIGRRMKAEEELNVARANTQSINQRIHIFGTRWASRISNVVKVLFGLIVLYAIYATSPTPFPQLPSTWMHYILPACFVLLGIFSFANYYWGTTVTSICKSFEGWLARKLREMLRLFLGISE